MITITKVGAAPAILRNRGQHETDELRQLYDAGIRQFTFDSGLYGAKSVKNALKKAQADKCGFCESKIPHIAYGDVEHYRPKGGYRQRAEDSLAQPGYYWLAYEWDNLFLACQLCNQRFKKNLFPLKDPSRRSLSHHDDLAAEEPELLSPATTDLASHIAFQNQFAHPVAESTSGTATIEFLGLNRPELSERRLDLFRKLVAMRQVLQALLRQQAAYQVDGRAVPSDLAGSIQTLETELDRSQHATAEYSAMAKALLG